MSSLERLGEAGWLPDVRSEESLAGQACNQPRNRLYRLQPLTCDATRERLGLCRVSSLENVEVFRLLIFALFHESPVETGEHTPTR